MIIQWKSDDHIKLADIYMDAPDNISCWDGCLESSFELMNEDPEEAIELLKNFSQEKEKMTDKEKLEKIKSFCQEKLDEHNSLVNPMDLYLDNDDYDDGFFSWTDFNKIINIIEGK